ncbi:MAG: aminotransferase class V-fold PLP-dependent enzyme [Actinomycetia bacterium]|nr:aminotransferase class V-fold PLP-dependent enzyme [Actinomycetes bacterium]
MMIDITRVRTDTPACENLAYFANAGASLPARSTLAAQKNYLDLEARVGGYEARTVAASQVDLFYANAAALLNSEPGEIAFQSGASEAWWRAFLSVDLQPGDRVLVGTTEFQSAAFGLMQARQRGIVVEMIPDDAHGQVDVNALTDMLRQPTKLVCLTQIAMSNGLVNPVERVGEVIKDTDALYLLDACQAAGQLPLDVQAYRCDFLTATGRKWLRGPRGTGLLYVRGSILDDLVDPVFVDGQSALWNTTDTYQLSEGSARFELGEMNPAGKVGLGSAIGYALDVGLDNIQDRVRSLAASMRDQLWQIPTITVTDRGEEQCGIVTFISDGVDPITIATALRAKGISVSIPSTPQSRFMFESVGVDAVVRAAPHYYNTEEEISRFIAELGGIVG